MSGWDWGWAWEGGGGWGEGGGFDLVPCVRRNKLNYPYCLRFPVFHKIRAWKSLVPN